MSMTLVNPMNETAVQAIPPPSRLKTLAGKTIALLDISKPGGLLSRPAGEDFSGALPGCRDHSDQEADFYQECAGPDDRAATPG